jgi:hypothetical protein
VADLADTMKKTAYHLLSLFTSTTFAGLLGGCSDLVDPETPPNPPDDAESYEGADTESNDESEETGGDEGAIPDAGTEEDGETGESEPELERIESYDSDPNGDLVVVASVGEAVLEAFPTAAKYHVRISSEDQMILLGLADANDEWLYAYRQDLGTSMMFDHGGIQGTMFFAEDPPLIDQLLSNTQTCYAPPCPKTKTPPVEDGTPTGLGRIDFGMEGNDLWHQTVIDGFARQTIAAFDEGEFAGVTATPVVAPPDFEAALARFALVQFDSVEILRETKTLEAWVDAEIDCDLAHQAPIVIGPLHWPDVCTLVISPYSCDGYVLDQCGDTWPW